MRFWKPAGTLLILALTSSAPAIDPKFLPPTTEAAITVNVKQLLDSELARNKKDLVNKMRSTIEEKLGELPAKAYLDKAGFDLFRDLHSITIASDGSKEIDSIFLAIEGDFDTDKLVEVAQEAARNQPGAIKVSKSGSVNVFEINPKGDEKTIYAGLISNRVLVAAPSREGLNASIARANGGRAAIKPAFKSLLDNTNAKQSVSIVATGDAIAKGMENAPRKANLGFSAQDVDGFSLALTVARDINFQIGVNTKDEDSAKKMAAAGNFGLVGLRGMIAQKAQDDAKIQPIVDIANTLRLTSQGMSILLRGEVSEANLDRLLSMLPRR